MKPKPKPLKSKHEAFKSKHEAWARHRDQSALLRDVLLLRDWDQCQDIGSGGDSQDLLTTEITVLSLTLGIRVCFFRMLPLPK